MTTEETELTFIRCPNCRSLVPAVATRCRMCGHQFGSKSTADNSDAAQRKSRVRQRTISASSEEVEEIKRDFGVSKLTPTEANVSENVPEPDDVYAYEAEDEPVEAEADPRRSQVEQDEAEEDDRYDDDIDDSYLRTKQVELEKQPVARTGLNFRGRSSEVEETHENIDDDIDDENVSDELEEPVNFSPEKRTLEQTELSSALPRRKRRRRKKGRGQQGLPQPGQINPPAQMPPQQAEISTINGGQREFSEFPSPAVSDRTTREVKQQEYTQRESIQRTEINMAHSEQVNRPNTPSWGEQRVGDNVPGGERVSAHHVTTAVDKNTVGNSLVGWLVHLNQDSRVQTSEISTGRFFVGRQKLRNSDVVISDNSISTPHCLVTASIGEGIIVQDLMSEQGTFIKRNRSDAYSQIQNVVSVEHGDFIRFGNYEVLVCLIPYPDRRQR